MEPEGSSPHSQIPPPLSTLRQLKQTCSNCVFVGFSCIPLNAELNPICHLLALLAVATIVVVSTLRVKVTDSTIQFHYTIPLYNSTIQFHYTIPLYNSTIQFHYTIPLFNSTLQFHYTIPLYNSPIQFPSIFYLTVSFKILNFSFLFFLKCLLTSCLTLSSDYLQF